MGAGMSDTKEPKLKAQSSSPAGYFAFDDDNNVWEEVMGADSPGAVPLYHANYIDLLPETHTTRCFKCGHKTTVKLSYATFPAQPADPVAEDAVNLLAAIQETYGTVLSLEYHKAIDAAMAKEKAK